MDGTDHEHSCHVGEQVVRLVYLALALLAQGQLAMGDVRLTAVCRLLLALRDLETANKSSEAFSTASDAVWRICAPYVGT
jgi:hypothetical protein